MVAHTTLLEISCHGSVILKQSYIWIKLVLTMQNLYNYCCENRVYPDQLAYKKPADLDSHCFFHSACKCMLIMGALLVYQIKIGKVCRQ